MGGQCPPYTIECLNCLKCLKCLKYVIGTESWVIRFAASPFPRVAPVYPLASVSSVRDKNPDVCTHALCAMRSSRYRSSRSMPSAMFSKEFA